MISDTTLVNVLSNSNNNCDASFARQADFQIAANEVRNEQEEEKKKEQIKIAEDLSWIIE